MQLLKEESWTKASRHKIKLLLFHGNNNLTLHSESQRMRHASASFVSLQMVMDAQFYGQHLSVYCFTCESFHNVPFADVRMFRDHCRLVQIQKVLYKLKFQWSEVLHLIKFMKHFCGNLAHYLPFFSSFCVWGVLLLDHNSSCSSSKQLMVLYSGYWSYWSIMSRCYWSSVS